MSMRSAKTYHTDAVVLALRPLGESDAIAVLLTPAGMVSSVVKGVRRPKSTLAALCQPFTEIRALLHKGRSLDVLAQAQILNMHAPLRGSLGRLCWAAYLCDFIMAVSAEPEPMARSYQLLLTTLSALEQSPQPGWSCLRAMMVLICLYGYAPRLDSCISCERKTDLSFYSPDDGGVVCSRCASVTPGCWALPPNIWKCLRVWESEAESLRAGHCLEAHQDAAVYLQEREELLLLENLLWSHSRVMFPRRIKSRSLALRFLDGV